MTINLNKKNANPTTASIVTPDVLAQFKAATKGAYIDTREITSPEAAAYTYVKVIQAACNTYNKNITVRPYVEVTDIGNEYYGYAVYNKFGICMLKHSIAQWVESGQYCYSQKYCGNAKMISRKIYESINYLKQHEEARFAARTEEKMRELIENAKAKRNASLFGNNVSDDEIADILVS